MPRELRDLGQTIELRRTRRGRRLVPLVAVLVVAAAVTARASDGEDPSLEELVLPAAPANAADAYVGADGADDQEVAAEPPAPSVPVLGRVGDLLLHVPAQEAVLISYHEAAYPQASAIAPLGALLGNENPTRQLAHDDHPDGVEFHVQVSRGRANASTSAVDVVLLPGVEVRAPVSGTITEVRPYQLYGVHADVRIELQPDGAPDRAIVLIHVEDVMVERGDRVEVGDVLAGGARKFPFSAVVDRQTEPERYGHVHMEVKEPGG